MASGWGFPLLPEDIVLVTRKIHHLRRLDAKPLLSGLVRVSDDLQGNVLASGRRGKPHPEAICRAA